MKKQALLWGMLLLLSGVAIAADEQQDAEARQQECTQWAMEDGLNGAELEAYVTECLAQE